MEQNKRIRKIVNSIKQPSKNCIWLKDGKLYYYGTTGWTEIQGQDKVTGVATTWTDLDGMKYSNSTITKFQDGYKFAPRTGINCYSMFSSCRELIEVPLFDTSEATEMSQMFTNTKALQTIPEFNTEKVTSFGSMFSYSGIVTFPALNTPLLENADYMFNYCNHLISVGKLDFSNVTSAIQMFYRANNLTTLGGFTGLKVNFDLSDCTVLTKESIITTCD